jgi:transketolase
MNMSEFINSIQLKISDLENIGKVGYVEGISNIIIKELNETQLNKRPVHCSDVKRETLYVKEENKWEKDTDDTKKMIKAVRDVNKKNYQMLANWKGMYPNFTDSNSKQSEEFTHLVSEVVMDNNETNVKKVIKNVAKQVIIEK